MSDTESQRIGRAGEDLFRVLLPSGWYKHKRDPDPYVDFIVEPVKDSQQLPESALFQVKSRQVISGKPSCRVEIKTLKFARTSRIPVFLALIGIENEFGWYKNISEMANEIPFNMPFWSQVHTNIKLDKKSDISNSDQLLSNIHDAWKALDERYPGSLESAAKFKRSMLEQADPRFEFTVAFDGNSESIKCVPKSKDIRIEVSIRSRTEGGANAVQKFLDEGGAIGPSDDLEVEVKDAPGNLGKTLSANIETYSKADGDIKWQFINSNGSVLASHIFAASWKGGRRKRVSPMSLQGVDIFSGLHAIEIFPDRKMIQNHFNFEVKYSLWTGQDVLLLPGFYQLITVFGDAGNAASLRMGPIFGGEWICADQPLDDRSEIKNLSRFLDIINRMREISKKLGLEIVFDHEKIEGDLNLIYDLFDGLAGEGCSMGSGDISFVVGAAGADGLKRNMHDGGAIRHTKLVQINLMGRDCGNVLELTEGIIYDADIVENPNGDMSVQAKIDRVIKKYFRPDIDPGTLL